MGDRAGALLPSLLMVEVVVVIVMMIMVAVGYGEVEGQKTGGWCEVEMRSESAL